MATLTSSDQARLGLVRPELMRALLHLLDAAAATLGVRCQVPDYGGTRSLATQQELYEDSIAQGGGVLAYPVGKPGRSRHNYGAAVDLHIVAGGTNDNGTGSDDDYLQLAEVAESLGELTAGYFFAARGQGQSDPYHFQLAEPLETSIARWNAMASAGIGTTVALLIAGALAVRALR
ncbi:MAG: D-alanyl-D-alanine carboxypeptidase family protein [bacterium]